MTAIVLDAGAFLELLLGSPAGRTVDGLVTMSAASAPDLLDAEVFHRLVRWEKSGALGTDAVSARLEMVQDAPIERVPCRPLLRPARRYARALSGYDALYAALAAVLDCPLVTTDARLAATAVSQFDLAVVHVPTSGR